MVSALAAFGGTDDVARKPASLLLRLQFSDPSIQRDRQGLKSIDNRLGVIYELVRVNS